MFWQVIILQIHSYNVSFSNIKWKRSFTCMCWCTCKKGKWYMYIQSKCNTYMYMYIQSKCNTYMYMYMYVYMYKSYKLPTCTFTCNLRENNQCFRAIDHNMIFRDIVTNESNESNSMTNMYTCIHVHYIMAEGHEIWRKVSLGLYVEWVYCV